MPMQPLKYVLLVALFTSFLYGSTSPIRFSRYRKFSSGERLDRLKQQCDKRNLRFSNLKGYEIKYTFQHMIVNDDHGILYCYIPKVACSNWKRVMTVLNGDANDTEAIDHVDHKSFKTLASYPPAEAQYRLQNYYKFMFVREPLGRLVSAFKDKLTGENEYYEKVVVPHIIQKYRNRNKEGPSKGVTLEEFFLSLKSVLPGAMDEHWMPMFQICQPCAVSYDFIGALENINEESEDLLNEIQVKNKVNFPRKQEMYTRRSGSTTQELLDEIPRNLLQTILSKYKNDYQLFSYDIPEI